MRIQESSLYSSAPLGHMHKCIIYVSTIIFSVIAIAELSEACLSFAIKHKDHLTFKGLDTWYLIALARFQELGLVAANTITRVGEIMRF